VLNEMDRIAAMAAKRRLAQLGSRWAVHIDPEELEEEAPLYNILPYGLIPTEVPYQQVVALLEKTSPKKKSEEQEEPLPSKRLSLNKKIIIKPRLVDLEDDGNFDENEPGPSNRAMGFIPISQDTEEEKKEAHDEEEIVENSQEKLVECPICSLKFEQSKIEVCENPIFIFKEYMSKT